ncbi:MAG: ABC transporter substrate-binding protein [Lachnospiraceae bacterium]|nr:ABC transporter substrate-binding protein [Lachnospiraceae bacterium]
MKFKKALSLALCGVMVAGCFGTVASADEELTWKIGGIGPITGAASAYGSAAMNGAQIAVDEINAAGGVNGYQIEFNAQDDEHDSEKSVNAYNTLKDWGMQALVGTVTTAPCLAVAPLAAEDNMFMITPSASAEECISYGTNEFRMCFTDPAQGTASAQYIGENLDVTKVGVIYDSSDVYSSGIYATFRTEAENQDFEIVAAEAFTSDSKTDFSAQIQAMIDAGAELVFLPFYYNEASIVFTQAASMEYSPLWFGVDGMDGILSVEGFDLSLAEGVMLLTPFSADAEDELTQTFVATYQDLYGETPNQFAADGYDCIYAIATALATTDLDPSADASTISDALQAAMLEISMDGLTGSGMTWDEDGEVSKSPKAVVIQDGVYVGL